MAVKSSIWALVLVASAPFCYGQVETAIHIGDKDIKVEVLNGVVHATECSSLGGAAANRRKHAMALAGREIVKWKNGVAISGNEGMQGRSFNFAIYEDSVGLIGPLVVVREDIHGGDNREKWCVTVKEEYGQSK